MAVVPYKETMKRLLRTPMQKTFTFLGVTLVLIIVFLMGAIRPTISTITKLQKQIDSRQEVDQDLQTKIDNLQDLQKKYEAQKEDLEFVDLYYPEDSDYSLYMASLEKIATKYGYTLDSLQINADTSGKSTSEYSGMQRVSVRIVITGGPSNLVKMLEHLQDMPVVPNITQIAITPVSETDVTVNINMTAYKTM